MLVYAIQQHESAIGIHMSHPFRLSESTRIWASCHRANSHWLPILHIVIYIYIFLCYILNSSHRLLPLLCAQVCFLYLHLHSVQLSSVQFSRSVMSESLPPHELQHTRPPCPSPTPGVHSNSRPSSRWCHPAISSSVIPFSSCPQSLPASESFPMSQLFAWGGQSTGVSASASFLRKNTQDWSPLEWTGWISLQSKGLSRPQFKSINSSAFSFLHSPTHIHTWPLEKP